MDVATYNQRDGAGEPQSGRRRLRRGGRRRSDVLGRRNRYRWLHAQPHRDPREPRGLRRSGRADLAGARRLQAQLSARHLAREAVRRLTAAAVEPSGRRAPPARRLQPLKGNTLSCFTVNEYGASPRHRRTKRGTATTIVSSPRLRANAQIWVLRSPSTSIGW